MKCPKCGRDTYSKKWGSCTACGYGDVAAAANRADRLPTHPITHVTTKPPIVAEGVTPVMGRAEVVTCVMPGEECPTCHRKMPSKNAMKQAAWRASKEGS